jgi:hypothetical protein
MASIEKRTTPLGEVRWDVRYRGSDRRQAKRTFKRKIDAQRFAATTEADVLRGEWIDPRRARETFGHWAAQWQPTTTHLKPKTRAGYESILGKHLLPRFADEPLCAIDHPRVLAFLSDLAASGYGPGTVRNVRDVFRLVMALAVRSGAIKHNPVLGARLGRPAKQEMVFLTADQVMRLAEEIASPPHPSAWWRASPRLVPRVRPAGSTCGLHGPSSWRDRGAAHSPPRPHASPS